MTILQYCSQVYLCLAVLGPLDQLVLLARVVPPRGWLLSFLLLLLCSIVSVVSLLQPLSLLLPQSTARTRPLTSRRAPPRRVVGCFALLLL